MAQQDYLRDEASYLAHVRRLWDAAWPASVPRDPVYPLGENTLTHYLREWARRQPDKAAILFYGRAISYRELDEMSDRFAALLARLGARKGDRVAVFLPNCPQFFFCFHGILKAGCVHVPVNPIFTAPELVYELNDTGATILIAHDQLLGLVEAVQGQTSVKHVFVTSFLDMLPAEPEGPLPSNLMLARQASAGAADLLNVLRRETGPVPTVEVGLDDIAALNYTGGTTGMPKGCVHTQRDMVMTGAVMSSISTRTSGDDVIINFWPIFWMAGEDVALIMPLITGSTCVLLARWDAVAFMKAVARHRAAIAMMVVDNAVEVMERPEAADYDLSSLREVLVASFVKKLNPAFRAKWRALTGAVLREAAWGMTETHSYDSFTSGFQDDDRDLKAQQVFVGLPSPGSQFKIMEFGSTKLVPLGQEGELCIASPTLLKGYWNKPDANAEGLVDGWLRTGDIGMISETGTLHFLGRRKEMLKVKGMSVFPAEIEAVLGQHPAVTGSGVVGREDEVRGQTPIAFVTVLASAKDSVSAQSLDAFCRERLAVYKIPEIRIVEALPMTATGKVRKEELAKQL